jgi:hypothetical protein
MAATIAIRTDYPHRHVLAQYDGCLLTPAKRTAYLRAYVAL